jgi:Flp pilus assembly protein TadB
VGVGTSEAKGVPAVAHKSPTTAVKYLTVCVLLVTLSITVNLKTTLQELSKVLKDRTLA